MQQTMEKKMSCCGQHRDQIRSQGTANLSTDRHSLMPAPSGRDSLWGNNQQAFPGKGTVALRYREHARLQVRGPITGRTYDFPSDRAAVMVDARDADTLLRTRLFTRVVNHPHV